MKKYTLHDDPNLPLKTAIDYKAALNTEQYEVVTEGEGYSLVLAGAGSGKTRTLIYRLAYLIEKGVPPESILLMTFTNKAAREMRDRTEILLKNKPKGLWNGTFHHVGNRILRMYAEEAGYTKDFAILDEHDSRDLIKTCVGKRSSSGKADKFPKPSVVQSIISYSVNTEKTLEKVVDEKYPYFSQFLPEIKRVREMYEKKKRLSNCMDYDDLLERWKWLLENVPDVRGRLSSRFRYIMVDEYQDTNILQSDISDMLASKNGNLLVVGDDAQSIYSFRGASVKNILSFPDRHKDAKIFRLETNYRSTPEILDLANDSLVNNLDQFEKELRAVSPPFEKPALVETNDSYSQSSFVVQRVLELREQGVDMKGISVLFRAHYQSAELEMELVKRNIPYVIRGGVRFFEQAHIKDVISYLRILTNSSDEISWTRALTLCPGIGPAYAVKIFERFLKSGASLKSFMASDISRVVPEKARSGFGRFVKIMSSVLEAAKGDDTAAMINSILVNGYETYVMATFDNAKDRIDDLRELANFSHEYGTVNDFLNDITLREGFKGETSEAASGEEEYLVLSTIHQAKGLEWDAVFIIGLSEGQFPHAKALIEDNDLEEERRLFYVAATRARKYLYLIHPRTRYDYQKGMVISRKSRFLEELPADDYELWETGYGHGGADVEDEEIDL
ncbi:MAG: ATP-dependent helicase [Candidatus Omnitrophica bacterium]|nr:ATP-dependent helicase [Candidatus Omnitrophota bacterium]